MDNKKIGEFLAQERKAKKMTQVKFAKLLHVSEKTVSKWENGNGLPETGLLPKICEIFEINLNELLSGERLENATYMKKAEENLSSLLYQRKDSKSKLILSGVVCFMSIGILVFCVLLAGYLAMPNWLRIFVITFGAVMAFLGIGVAVVLDINAGAYECKYCKTKFVPTLKAYIAGAHTLTRRHLKCPHCGKSSYCKKKLTK